MSVCLIKLPCTQASSPISLGDILLLQQQGISLLFCILIFCDGDLNIANF